MEQWMRTELQAYLYLNLSEYPSNLIFRIGHLGRWRVCMWCFVSTSKNGQGRKEKARG